MAAGILLAIWLAPQIAGVTNSPCNGSVGAQTQIDSEVCLGNESLRRGETAPKGSTQHSELFEAAVAHYRRAATRANNSTEKSRALGLLATAYDAQHLNDLPQEEAALRELIATINGAGDGIILVGRIGITSHFGDVLRRARIPSRIEEPAS